MRTTSWLFLILISLHCTAFLALSGCVTVKLAGESGTKASGIELREPVKPFAKESRPEVDAAWKNNKNGNLISYISDCNDPTDPPLAQIVMGILGGLTDMKTLEESSPMIQGREGQRVHASGKVDGVPTEIDLLAYKRNHCIYILSYVGVKKSFGEDRAAFSQFIDGFRAP
jgi:hypothetical protein